MTAERQLRELRRWAQRRSDAQELVVRSLHEVLLAELEIDRLLDQIALERETDRMA